MSTKPKPPFKGRPALELLQYTDQSLIQCSDVETQLDWFNDLMIFLVDMDSDCNPKLDIEKSTDNPTGLAPEAMVEKMDLLLQRVSDYLIKGVPDDFYVGVLEIFENSVLKLHQPHYVQFITYLAASTSKQRADDLLSLLLNIVHDEQSDPIARREAIACIGSFVCRATFLGWTHSARTAKYLVSFMHGLDISKSSSDRLLFALALQTVCYMICWECNNWKDHTETTELDWVFRSKKGLVPLLERTRKDCVLRLVSLDILSMLHPLAGRVSVQLRDLIGEAIATYRQLLPPVWKPLAESKLLKPSFPFDPFHNLRRCARFFDAIVREWEEPGEAPDASDRAQPAIYMTTDDSNGEEPEHLGMEHDDVWSFRPITAALGGYQPSPLMHAMACSPMMDAFDDPRDRMDSFEIGDNLVLNRILSSRTFASAPPSG